MNGLEILGKFLAKRTEIKKLLLILSFILIWISCGISLWLIQSPLWILISFLILLGVLLYTWFYSIRLKDVYEATVIDQLEYQQKTLLYIKDSTLVEAIRNRDLTSNKAEEIENITKLIKSISTLESSILISGILKKEGFTNYIPTDERDTEESEG